MVLTKEGKSCLKRGLFNELIFFAGDVNGQAAKWIHPSDQRSWNAPAIPPPPPLVTKIGQHQVVLKADCHIIYENKSPQSYIWYHRFWIIQSYRFKIWWKRGRLASDWFTSLEAVVLTSGGLFVLSSGVLLWKSRTQNSSLTSLKSCDKLKTKLTWNLWWSLEKVSSGW